MGSDDSVGESSWPPGEGKSGLISGDSAGGEDKGEGNNAGAAEIVEAGKFLSEFNDDDDDENIIKMVVRKIKNGLME